MLAMLSSAIVFSLVVFACSFCCALLGIAIRERLPPGHLCADSRDTIKLGVGLIATMTALVLGLLTASAKSSFDAADKGIRESATQIISLDRALVAYGPETESIRALSRQILSARITTIWPDNGKSGITQLEREKTLPIDLVARQIRELVPKNEEQRWLQSSAKATVEK